MTRDALYLHNMLDAIEKIEHYASVGRATYPANSHWQDAIIRQLEIIGEVAKRLSDSLRARHPDVPWRRIAGLRDVQIHQYMAVDLDAVWEVTQRDIPGLKGKIAAILAEPLIEEQ